jgi:sugar transferase (PEP-CTERM/EpsH1 system associated)
MRILFLAQRVPYPPDRGDKIHTYNQLRHLAEVHQVAVACLADGEEDLANIAGLNSLATSVDAVAVRSVRARSRALASLSSRIPFTVAYFDERRLHEQVGKRMRREHFDAILVNSSGMAQFVEPYSDVPRIMQFVDLDCLKWQQYADNSSIPRSWIFRREFHCLLEYERNLARTFTHSLVCTPRELKDLVRLVPGAAASCVSNGVDLEAFRPQSLEKIPAQLIFTGVMDYYPNVEGVIWFCREVLPLIRREVSGTTLTICGSRPNVRVKSLARIPGVTVTGRVPDVRPYLARASVAVVPLRIARGIQNKLLEAMAMGLPVVACSAAAGGVEATHGRDFFVADDPEDFAAATVRLLSDSEQQRRMGEAARTCMEANYRWEHQLQRLDRVLEEVTGSDSPRVPLLASRALERQNP